MSTRSYLGMFFIISFVSFLTFFLILFFVPPTDKTGLADTTFIVSLSLSVTGFLSIILYLVKTKILKKSKLFEALESSFRQSFIVGLMIAFILFLRVLRILEYWHILFVVFFGLAIEMSANLKK